MIQQSTQHAPVKYSAYGVPFGLPGGDTDSDGDCDSTDVTQVQTWITGSAYDVRGDVELDGDVDAPDKSVIQATFQGRTTGRGTGSSPVVQNHLGLSGYVSTGRPESGYYVRVRGLSSMLGRWTSRDPLGYVDEYQLYQYVKSTPISASDPFGLIAAQDFGNTKTNNLLNIKHEYPAPPWHDGGKWSKIESEMLSTVGPFTAKCIADAGADAAEAFPSDPNNVETNSLNNCMRHCVAACEMTKCLSKSWTDAFLLEHEVHSTNPNDPGQVAEAKEDMKNNYAGSAAGAEGKDCVEACEQHCDPGSFGGG